MGRIVVGLLATLAVGGIAFRLQPSPATPQVLSAGADDLTQIDWQDGIKVRATYLPAESSSTQATLQLVVTSTKDISNFDFAQNVVWADSNIDPLPTLSSALLRREPGELSFRTTFVRKGSHHHLLVRNLGAIRTRVLHFYL